MIEIADITSSSLVSGDLVIVNRAGTPATVELLPLLQEKQPVGSYAPALGVDDNYVTDAEKVDIQNLSGVNTGDQTSIVGITGTKAQFDTAVTDGNILYVGDVTSNATHTGDVTGSTALTIAADAVTFAKMQNIDTSRIIGRVTAATGDPEALTGTQATTLLDAFTSGLKGLAPASGGGTVNYLRADGTWENPRPTLFGQLDANYTLTSTTAAQKLFNWSTNGALSLATGKYRFLTQLYLTDMSATSGNGQFEILGAGTATLSDIIYSVNGFDDTAPLSSGISRHSASVTNTSENPSKYTGFPDVSIRACVFPIKVIMTHFTI